VWVDTPHLRTVAISRGRILKFPVSEVSGFYVMRFSGSRQMESGETGVTEVIVTYPIHALRTNRNLYGVPSKPFWWDGIRCTAKKLYPMGCPICTAIVPFLMGRNSMGCCISRRDDRSPLQKDQERFQSIQAPEQPMREVRYVDKEGKEAFYWARHNEALRTEGRSILRRQDAVKWT
jgi:hypothetical protein